MFVSTSSDSFANLIPMMIAVSTFSTAVITLIGFSISRKAAIVGDRIERATGEIHVIVNSQRTEMLKEIDLLKNKSGNLELSNLELKKMMTNMSAILLESKVSEGVAREALIKLQNYLPKVNGS